MKMKKFTLQYLIPLTLTFYTVTMVMIQYGIPQNGKIISDLEVPLDLDMEGSYVGQRLIFQYHTGKSEFRESMKIHDLDETLSSEKEYGNSPKRRSDFKRVGSVNVFSTYLDNRIPGKFFLTLITLRKTAETATIICHFHIRNGSYVNVTSRSKEMCENHGRLYGGWMYICDVPTMVWNEYLRRNRSLTYVSLSVADKPEGLIKFKVSGETVTENYEKIHEKTPLGICIPPLFGDISLSLLIQFIELSKLLGIVYFTFYNYEVSDSIYKLLRFYNMKGDATIVNWKLPDHMMDKEIWYHGQLLAIQDCLYRNMASTELLAFLDIDEFIIPTAGGSLSQLTKSMTENYTATDSFNVAGFSFRSAFFAPNQVLDPSQQLTLLQIRQRTLNLSAKRTKLIVRPEKISELGIHHVSKYFKENFRIVEVDPEVAKIHHYRACAINYEPEMNCLQEIQDDNILKYGPDLVKNYKSVLKKTLPLFMPKQRWMQIK